MLAHKKQSGSFRLMLKETKYGCQTIFAALFRVIITLGTDQESLEVITRNRTIACAVICSSVLLPLADTFSDILLTVEWLGAGEKSSDFFFGQMSLAILVVSALVTSIAMFGIECDGLAFDVNPGYWYNSESGFFHPVLGLLLSITDVRLPVVAALQIGDIIRHGVDDKYLVGPAEAPDRELGGKAATEMFRMFTPGASIVMALRLFELLGETILELLLQTYKASVEYFRQGVAPSLVLRVSIVVSFLTLAIGIVTTLLNLERFPTKLLATIYCLECLVARFAVLTALFVEFGYGGLYFTCVAYA